MEEIIQQIALFAITVHEAAHGYVARMFGDNTAYVLGRVTLNPVKHIDPLGTIVIPLGMVLLTGFMFGWAKPVPVDWGSLRRPKRDMIWVAAAGPGVNLVMAVVWALIYRTQAGISVNLVFMALNLLPIPPLDGGRIVSGVLPTRMSIAYSRIEPYGLIILLVLMFTGALSFFLRPLHEIGAAIVRLFL
jgi:Zn-dependent protease